MKIKISEEWTTKGIAKELATIEIGTHDADDVASAAWDAVWDWIRAHKASLNGAHALMAAWQMRGAPQSILLWYEAV